MDRHIVHPFAPVIDNNCKVLILGSVPSVKSVEKNFYYMHPQNRFWVVLSRLLNVDFLSMTAEEKRAELLRNNIGLYDVVYECDVTGSSDLSVKNAVVADIPNLIKDSKVSRIFCNGKTAYNTLLKHYPQLADDVVYMPSTSPSNAKIGIDELTKIWQEILK